MPLARVIVPAIAVAAAIFTLPDSVTASTTIEAPSWCKYTDGAGKVRFAGKCTINFGVGPAAGCSDPSQPKTLISRDILEFSAKSQVEIDDYCDGTETANGRPSFYGFGTHAGQKIVRVLTRDGELFEYRSIDESSPGAHTAGL
jgi:hypothetical protein